TIFLLANSPRREARLGIDGTVHLGCRVQKPVVVVAANDALLVDGELEDIVRRFFVALHESIDADRFPIFSRGWIGILADGGNVRRLIGVLLHGAGFRAVHIDVVVLVDDGAAVVVVRRTYDGNAPE